MSLGSASLGSADIANRFFSAVERNDMVEVESIYHDDIRIWHSFDGKTKNKIEGLTLLSRLGALVTRRYEVVERLSIGNREIQRHDVIIHFNDGSASLQFPMALFMTITAGQITGIDEYVDSTDAHKVFTAVETAERSKAALGA